MILQADPSKWIYILAQENMRWKNLPRNIQKPFRKSLWKRNLTITCLAQAHTIRTLWIEFQHLKSWRSRTSLRFLIKKRIQDVESTTRLYITLRRALNSALLNGMRTVPLAGSRLDLLNTTISQIYNLNLTQILKEEFQSFTSVKDLKSHSQI